MTRLPSLEAAFAGVEETDFSSLEKAFDDVFPTKLSLTDRIIRLADIVSTVSAAVSRAAPDPDRGIVGEIGARFVRGVSGSQASAGGIAQLAAGQIERVTGETIVTRGLETAGRTAEAIGRGGQAAIPPSQGAKFGARNILGTIAEAAPQVISQVGIAAATGGGSLPAQIVIFSGLAVGPVVGDQYLEALEFHKEKGTPNPENAAALEAGAAGLITAGTNIIPGIAILRKIPAGKKVLASAAQRVIGRVGRVGAAGGAESIQEMSEQVLTDATASLLRDDPEMMRRIVQRDPEYWSNIGLAGIAGLVLGGGARVGIEVSVNGQQRPVTQEQADRIAAIDNTPSRNDLRGVVKGSDKLNAHQRVQIKESIQEQLNARSRTQRQPPQTSQAQEEDVQPQVGPQVQAQEEIAQEITDAQAVPSPEAKVRQEQGRQDIRRPGEVQEGKKLAGQESETQVAQLTSARKAETSKDRAVLGLDELDSPARRSWQQDLDDAVSQGIPQRAPRLAAEVVAKPRSLSSTETAGVVTAAAQLKNEHAELTTQIGESKDAADTAFLSAEATRVEQEFDLLTEALRISGTIKGRELASQKLTINQDFQLVSVLNRAKTAKGKALSDVETKRITNPVNRLEAKDTQTRRLQAEIQRLTAELAIKKSRSRVSRNRITRETDLNAHYAKARRLLRAGCHNN